jgi:hypothetical protein
MHPKEPAKALSDVLHRNGPEVLLEAMRLKMLRRDDRAP